jgi:hypothetical protein
MKLSLRTATQQPVFRALESDASSPFEQARIQDFVKAKRSDLRNGLTRRQRTFVLEKLVGLNDKDAAFAAGYSLSVAENTKQRIWKPQVRAEWERLRGELAAGTSLFTKAEPPITEHSPRGGFLHYTFQYSQTWERRKSRPFQNPKGQPPYYNVGELSE